MKRDIGLFIEDISGGIKNIGDFTRGLNKEKFSKDTLRQSAVIRQLEIIGEAVKNIPDNFRKKYPEVPWKDIVGMRDKLMHHYFGANLNTVWKVIKEDFPDLKKKIQKIKNDRNNKI